ncbi:interferon gamma 1-like [Chelmon rostratus]|uniref:interferon gamma 1-like n=1 Tax=Chelmon rostratus TaxID=109905 RepID=UPI001BE6AE10|nr:interferon gamma 1-like [Chelmon rostratus]
MSSFRGSVCLLVLLGAVFASGSPAQFIPDQLKQTHKSIADVLELTRSDIVVNPLFSSVIRSINTSLQRKEAQLMNVTLDVYMQIFSSILQQHHDNTGTPTLLSHLTEAERSKVESALKFFQQKIKVLKRRLSQQANDREDVISELNKIQVDDPEAQRKALAQFLEIYQEASVICSRMWRPAHSSSAE